MLCLCICNQILSQNALNRFFTPADTLHKIRFYSLVGTGAVMVGGALIALNSVWYAEYQQSKFQLFNDWKEWEQMDKGGHLLTAYQTSRWAYEGATWTGVNRKKAVWTGVAVATLFQGGLEILDGFSAKWGFSLGDVAFNELGCALFAAQELVWHEQRIVPKASFSYPQYPDVLIPSADGTQTTRLSNRIDHLLGQKSLPQRFFKDYNGQTIWLCANISSFLPRENKVPKWLNLAIGYGAEGMYGGFGNSWTDKNGVRYDVTNNQLFPRYRQFYLSLDVDLSRIKTKNRLLKTLFSAVRFLKFPAPTLEFNSLGKVRFIPIFY